MYVSNYILIVQVKVGAQVTRYKDYESLYRDMKEFQTSGSGSGAAGSTAVAGNLMLWYCCSI